MKDVKELVGRTALLVASHYSPFSRRVALNLQARFKVNYFFADSESRFIEHYRQLLPALVFVAADVPNVKSLNVPDQVPLFQQVVRGKVVQLLDLQKNVPVLQLQDPSPRQAAEHITDMLLQKSRTYQSNRQGKASWRQGEFQIVRTDFNGPAKEADLDWLEGVLEEAVEGDAKGVCLWCNDHLFLPIQEPSLAFKLSRIMRLLSRRTKIFVALVDGEVGGEGNLLLRLFDLVFARAGTINFPYSKICNFPVGRPEEQHCPYFENAYPLFQDPFATIRSIDLQLLKKVQQRSRGGVQNQIKRYQRAAQELLKGGTWQAQRKQHNVGRKQVIRDTPISIKINCLKYVHHKLEHSIRPKVNRLKEFGCQPCICIFHFTRTAESEVYVRKKKQVFEREGFQVRVVEGLEGGSREERREQAKRMIRLANVDNSIHGMIVQLPINEMDQMELLEVIKQEKNIDGFSYRNFGMLALGGGQPGCVLPCTLRGIIGLMDFYRIQYRGKRITVIGKGLTIGIPTALFLSAKGATLTTCDINTVDLDQIVSQSDIVVCATDQERLVNPRTLHRNSIVLDAGFKVEGGSRISGNLDHREVREGSYTTVPGGIGAITVVEAMENTLDAFFRLAG